MSDATPAPDLWAYVEALALAEAGQVEEAGALLPMVPSLVVRNLFDAYASYGYDWHVLAVLHSRVPQLVGEAFQRHAGPAAGRLDIADVGAGTGLLVAYLRRWARRLVAVDLSPGMLGEARQRCYDEYVCADLVGWLADQRGAFDAVTASDVACYLGNLTPMFTAAARALRPGGLLVVSVERSDSGDVVLVPSVRFQHSGGHLRRAVAAAGLVERELVEAELRQQSGRPVPGYILVAARPAR